MQQLEQIEQKITHTLRMIDSSLVNAQHVASGLLDNMKKYSSNTKTINDSLKTWSKFFTSFPSVQAPSFTNATNSTLGSSYHFGKSIENALVSTPGSHMSGEISDLLRKISPPRTTPFSNGRNLGRRPDGKSMDSLESLRQITPPLTTPFMTDAKERKTKATADYSCQRKLDDDMNVSSDKNDQKSFMFMSPSTQQFGEDFNKLGGEKTPGLKSTPRPALKSKEATETPLAARTNNSITSADISDIDDAKYPSTPNVAKLHKPDVIEEVQTKVARKLILSEFPSIYQHGRGANQLEQVYMQFVSENMTVKKPLTLVELQSRMAGFGAERLTLLLELLISRGFIQTIGKGRAKMYVCNSEQDDADELLDITAE